MNNSIMTRKFERLLFDGIPEQPEGVYERDGNGFASLRMSGRSLAEGEYVSQQEISIGTYEYNLETGKVTYVPNKNAIDLLTKELNSK